MQRYRAGLDEAHSMGLDHPWLNFTEAMYAVIAGDEAKALAQLNTAVERGWRDHQKIAEAWPAFKPLEGNPQYEEIQSRLVNNIDTERSKLGLASL